jgi:hypothetical protein
MTAQQLLEAYENGQRDFIGANLTGANLAGANLAGANLTGANLAGANLNNINTLNTNLSNCQMSKGKICGLDLGDSVNVVPFGKPNGRLSFFIYDEQKQAVVICGCFVGNFEGFKAACAAKYPNDPIQGYQKQIEYLQSFL